MGHRLPILLPIVQTNPVDTLGQSARFDGLFEIARIKKGRRCGRDGAQSRQLGYAVSH
jgi:hypothetical protein